MHIIAISNRKGGTGKTTVAVNLAAELAALGYRVLLIDLDSQGHCAVGLGVTLNASAATAHDVFVTAAATLEAAIDPTPVENLWLAPANDRFDHGQSGHDLRCLARAIHQDNLSQKFDFILIDTPPSLDTLFMNALLAAHRVLVPYVPHHLAFQGVRQLLRALFPVMTKTNRNLKLLGFLPVMAANQMRQHRKVTGQVVHDFGESRVLRPIRTDIRLAEAMAAGQPIRQYAPKSRGAQDFAELAQEVINRPEAK